MGLVRPVHVWVDLTNSWANPAPGVLVEWRKADRPPGWEAWVIRVDTYSTGHGSAAQVVQSWVPAHLIRRAAAPQPERDLSGFRPAGGRSS